jgi:hypothetical protein
VVAEDVNGLLVGGVLDHHKELHILAQSQGLLMVCLWGCLSLAIWRAVLLIFEDLRDQGSAFGVRLLLLLRVV